ncbi:MAG: GTP cyclohydrolase 1 [candidate division WS2 bacterium]|nr:GTP cyclohydrolase 1 [Candidatus Psychracetigena formicireducens]
MDQDKIRQAVLMIIEAIGEDPLREGIKDTPERVAGMYAEVFRGLEEDPRKYLQVQFGEAHDEMILLKDISFYSMCEHHLLPFMGRAHVAYIPQEGRVVGLSGLAQVVDCMARRPQMQERLTSQVADILMECLQPRGVAVVVEAEHLCMSMRGIKKPGTITITSAVRGIFRRDARTRGEFFSLIKGWER